MIALLVVSSGWAFQWDEAEAPLADQMTVHFCRTAFSAEIETQIFQAMNAWQAGDATVLRGARWTYVRGPDRPDEDCGPGNGFDEVHAQDEDWFADHDAAGALATTMNDDVSVSSEVDFVWNTIDLPNWSAAKPSGTAEGEYSVGMIALHEFGHGVGFNHENATVAVMNSSYPNSGDLSAEYRPHADEYAGMAARRPSASRGTNLLLGKFVEEPGDPGDSIEVWDEADERWTVCRGPVAPEDGPEGIYGAIWETDGPQDATVTWRVSADERCFRGEDEFEVGRTVREMTTGVPELLSPDGYDFGAVPPGQYTLCAKIDADRAIEETREADNKVRSQVPVTVQDCR